MKRLIYLLFFATITMTSCIDAGLDDLPIYDEAEITDFDLEHRYVTTNANGVERMTVVTLNADVEISEETNTVTVTASIPAPTTQFTQDERRKITLESITAYAKVSPAAKMEPIDGAPVLGKPGDFSVERSYRVTAADGKTSKVWTIKINPLPVINNYEGSYTSAGRFVHPNGPRDFEGDKYLSSVDATTISTTHSDLGAHGYKINVTVNSDNTVVVTQFNGDGTEIGEMVPGEENSYNPSSKTFTLNYRYSGGGGYRVISETLKLK
ncbi:DUF4361 domain-containing protein [Puteibacter caeruleilacunae]|nr:DUF4361 domain-containing protein [Puteibacter caeruleilacunae]